MQPNPKTPLIQYKYDALNRLVSSAPLTQDATQRFYLKDHLVTEIQGTLQRSIMQHEDQLLAQQQRQSGYLETGLLATDQQRSVQNVLYANRLNPLAYAPYGYRPFGNGSISLLGFNGEQPDPVTGCYSLGNGFRAFNPILTRFHSPDSVGFIPFGKGGFNAYAYCGGDPLNRVDPTGHVLSFIGKMLETVNATDSSFIKGLWTTTKQSLRRNSKPMIEPISAARQHIDNVVGEVANSPPFVQRLEAVNKNLISHGNHTLPMAHALHYEKLVQQVSSGELSNTGAHASSATMWAEKFVQDRRPSGVIGAVFNGAGGTLLSGVYDHSLQKTGKALRQVSPPTKKTETS